MIQSILAARLLAQKQHEAIQMKIKELPSEVVYACRQRGLTDQQIEEMTISELFNEFCNWNGLINWSDRLLNVVNQLKKAKRKKIGFVR